MREPVTERDKEVFREVLADPETAASSYGRTLFIGGVDYSARIDALRTFCEEDGPAIVLEATIKGRLPLSIEGREVALDATFGSASMSAFRGTCLRPTPGARTKIVAASSGKKLEHKPLGARTSYDGLEPHTVLMALLSRGGYRNVNVPRVRKPLFRRSLTTEADGRLPETTLIPEILEAVRKECGVRVWDDGENVARGFREESLEEPGDVVAEWEVGRHIRRGSDTDGFSYPYAHETRYSQVKVYRTDDAGEVEILAKAKVWNQNADPDDVLYVELSEDSEENAYEVCYREAHRLSTDAWELETLETVMIDERVERGDTVAITEEVAGENGPERLRWLVRITGFEKDHEGRGVSYSGRLTLQSVTPLVSRTHRRRERKDVVRPLTTEVTWNDGRTWQGLGDYTWKDLG